jgi:hypothetical protein
VVSATDPNICSIFGIENMNFIFNAVTLFFWESMLD